MLRAKFFRSPLWENANDSSQRKLIRVIDVILKTYRQRRKSGCFVCCNRRLKRSNSSIGIALKANLRMAINTEPQQRWNEERMLTTISVASKLRLNPAFDLKCFWTNNCAAISNSRPISID